MIQSAGVIVVDWSEVEPKALCVRAYKNWDFPKGKLDEGESHIAAAIRELHEETTLAIGADAVLVGVNAPPITYGSGSRKKTATYFLADRASAKKPFLPISLELGRPENDEYRWVPIKKLTDIMPPRLTPVIAYVSDWSESYTEGSSDQKD